MVDDKGGSEATVRVAKADLVPTEANLLPAYEDWEALEAACEQFCSQVNARPHRVTRRAPVEMLAEEQARLHRLPEHPYTTAFGQARSVGLDQPMVQLNWCQYSVPSRLAGQTVWARIHANQVILTHIGATGPVEVARQELTTPGNPRVNADHFPAAPETPLHRTPIPASTAEKEFLAIGAGAALWLTEAGANGVRRVRAKMADAVGLAKLAGPERVDWALGHAALHGRFADGDLASIVAHRSATRAGDAHQASEAHSLQPGTSAWEGFGQ